MLKDDVVSSLCLSCPVRCIPQQPVVLNSDGNHLVWCVLRDQFPISHIPQNINTPGADLVLCSILVLPNLDHTSH